MQCDGDQGDKRLSGRKKQSLRGLTQGSDSVLRHGRSVIDRSCSGLQENRRAELGESKIGIALAAAALLMLLSPPSRVASVSEAPMARPDSACLKPHRLMTCTCLFLLLTFLQFILLPVTDHISHQCCSELRGRRISVSCFFPVHACMTARYDSSAGVVHGSLGSCQFKGTE